MGCVGVELGYALPGFFARGCTLFTLYQFFRLVGNGFHAVPRVSPLFLNASTNGHIFGDIPEYLWHFMLT
jgi:hypothetical protein